MRRFLSRVWELVLRHQGRLRPEPAPRDERQALHRAIQQVSQDLPALRYNTAVATLMAYLNMLQPRATLHDEEASGLLLLLAPFAPHIAEELWARLGKPYSIHQQRFPTPDLTLLARSLVRVAVQVNGRTRGLVELAPDAEQADAVQAARRVAAVRQVVEGAPLRRVIYVPGRIINLVTA